MNSLPRKIVLAASFALLALTVAVRPSRVAAQSLMSFTKDRELAKNVLFYRIRATFKVKETGKDVDFDVVSSCSRDTIVYRDGGSTVNIGRDPKFYAQRVGSKNQSVLMMQVPSLCNEYLFYATGEPVFPPNLRPFMIWIENGEDLSDGIGYATSDAYESTNSKISFEGSTVSLVSAQDRKAWEETEAKKNIIKREYFDEPYAMATGAVKTHLFANDMKSTAAQISARRLAYITKLAFSSEPNIYNFMNTCRGVVRLKLSDVGRQFVEQYWPKEHPDTWLVGDSSVGVRVLETMLRGRDADRIFVDHALRNVWLVQTTDTQYGVPDRNGEGVNAKLGHRSDTIFASDTFPEFHDATIRNFRNRTYSRRPYNVVSIDTSPILNGFVSCSHHSTTLEGEIPDPDELAKSKIRPAFELDGNLIGPLENARNHTGTYVMFVRNEYVLVRFWINLQRS